MYAINDKRRLYQLIEMYLSNKISTTVFCDEFYNCYDLELDKSNFSEIEIQKFEELNKVSSRYSQYEEDFKLDPKAFATDEEVYEKVKETQYNLKSFVHNSKDILH